MSNSEKLSHFLNKAKKLGDNNFNNKIRVAILSSFTINGLEESLRVKLYEKKMIWLIIFIGVMAYAVYRINTFADDVNPYNFSRRDNNK